MSYMESEDPMRADTSTRDVLGAWILAGFLFLVMMSGSVIRAVANLTIPTVPTTASAVVDEMEDMEPDQWRRQTAEAEADPMPEKTDTHVVADIGI